MCGRYTLTVDAASLQIHFPWLKVPKQLAPRYNIAPSQPIPVITNANPTMVDHFIWGLIPYWAKDPLNGNKMINARGETLAEKPTFRSPYKRKRCLILADGFYEWSKIPGEKTKTPYYIHLKSKKVFAFAGLWEEWHGNEGSLIYSAAIITTNSNQNLKRIHHRTPVILKEKDYDTWLSKDDKLPKALNHLLIPYPEEELVFYPVSTMVNNPRTDHPACIQAV